MSPAVRAAPLGIATVTAALLAASCSPAREDRALRYYIAPMPFSSDPMDIDHMSNNMAFAPVYSGLVSDFERGSYQGVLAESWTASADHRTWAFTMRRGIRFEDGTEVDAGHVVSSWRRLAKLKRKRGSGGGFMERLEGYDRPGPGGDISGLSHDGRSIALRFREPYPNLLAALSETVNSVVSPACFNPESGAWVCSRSAHSSGPYRVVRWDDAGVELALRPDFPGTLRHPKAAARAVLSDRWSAQEADLIFGASDRRPAAGDFSFQGGLESGIAFVHCLSWARPGGACADPAVRRTLRGAFVESLKGRGAEVAGSFFPSVIPGVSGRPGHPDRGGRRAGLRGADVTFDPVRGKGRGVDLNAALESAITAAGGRPVRAELTPKEWDAHLDPRLPNRKADILFAATEVTPDQSESSVRFMFLSKEGIRLPDPTGRIRKELSKERLDFGRIDDLLHEDALVWPYRHFAWGTWTRRDVDMSRVNVALPNPRLQWVGWR